MYVGLTNFHRSPNALRKVHHILALAKSETSEDEQLWNYLYCVLHLFLSEFRRIAPPVNHTGQLTLADLKQLHFFQCQLDFYDEVPQPSAITPREQQEYDDWDDPSVEARPAWPFPHFQPSDVVVPYDDPTTIFDIIPGKVFVNGQQVYYKAAWTAEESSVGKYCKTHASNLPPEQLRTSRLYGVVVDSAGGLYGQLYHWINISKRLSWDVLEKEPEATRDKWLAQIQQTVATMHDLGLIWGDVKAQNVVIDEDDGAIVIDMGGGATKGWIDKDKVEMREGDLQGLERLVDYITNDQSPLRLRDKERDWQYTKENLQ